MKTSTLLARICLSLLTPHLPLAEVQTTQAADYMTLLSAPTIVSSETSVGEVTP